MKKLRNLGLTVKSTFDCKDEVVERVIAVLRTAGCSIYVDRKRMKDIECAAEFKELKSTSEIDALLVIGGDGTILRSVRELEDFSVPILSVNRGAVGFLAETNIDEVEEWIPVFLDGGGVVEERSMLSVEVLRAGKSEFKGFCLNEAVIAQGSIARLLDLKTTVEGEALTTFHADGLIISTPTGSTAYSLAAGGPVVHPRLSAMILTPINPHSFTQKPIVIPAAQVVEAEVVKKENAFVDSDVSLTLDGQVYHPLQRYDIVRVTLHPHTVKFIRRAQDTFFATLRKKLHWGGNED